MPENLLAGLTIEYQVLAASFDKHATVGYSVLPVAFTVIGGALIIANPLGPYSGLAASLALLMVLAWVGAGHSVVNAIGLRLVAIELRMRQHLLESKAEAPEFFTGYVSQGSPSLRVYFVLFGVVGCSAEFLAMYQWWLSMEGLAWPLNWRIVGVVLPVGLNIFALATICSVELRVGRTRTAMIEAASQTELEG